MENVPEKIYLQIGENADINTNDFNELFNDAITWCPDKINENDIEFVRSDLPINENSGLHKHIVNCFKTDGEQLIKTLGFELDCEYDHDHFHTNRYRKGLLMVEFTYNGFRLETVDLTIDETFCKPITYAELKAITPVLGEIPA